MWSLFVAVILLLPLLTVLATILHVCKIIQGNNPLINFSVLKNIQSFIPKRITTNSDSFRDPSPIFDSSRVFWAINVILVHYGMILTTESLRMKYHTEKQLNSQIVTLLTFYCRCGLLNFFMFNGIASGKWFFRQFKTNPTQSMYKLMARFYLERFLSTAPMYYLFLFSFMFYIKFIITEDIVGHNMNNICSESLVSHLMFTMNFIQSDDLVS